MSQPRFVQLKHNVRVIPNGAAKHVVVQADTKLLVTAELSDNYLEVEKLDGSMTFAIKDDKEIEDTEMFKVNDVCFDKEMNEHVLISNGKCVLDHSHTEAYKNSHEGLADCVFKPYEAIAIRCVGVETIEAIDAKVPVCGWVYRTVNADHLRKSNVTIEEFRSWMQAATAGRM